MDKSLNEKRAWSSGKALTRRRFLEASGAGLAGAYVLGAAGPALAQALVRPNSVVVDGSARFQVLTPTLIRLEYAADGNFEDRPTFNVVNRDFPVPSFETRVVDGYREIRTDKLVLRYRLGSGPFSSRNTSVQLNVAGKSVTANPSWRSVCLVGEVCQAEDAELSGGAAVAGNHENYTGTGFVAGYENLGAGTTWTLAGVPAAGTYTFAFRYANYPAGSGQPTQGLPRTLSLYLNGQDTGQLSLPETARWDDWRTHEVEVELRAGTNTIALTRDSDDSGRVNIDHMVVTEIGAPMPQPPEGPSVLGGWRRGLDVVAGSVPLNEGLLSRDGYYLLEDTRTVVLTADGWIEPRPQRSDVYQDGYFFGYGHDYKRGLRDLVRLTGPVPMLPAWAFGFWNSSRFVQTDAQYRAELQRFRQDRIPVDVLVVDTEVKEPGEWYGWNWDERYLPDPKAFLDHAHGEGLKVCLNIHPGIVGAGPDKDPRFADAEARAGGLYHPDGTNLYGWDLSERDDVQSYFSLHEVPFERDGVDFFWLDNCCGRVKLVPGLSVDAWNNSLYADRLEDQGRRGFSFGRIGGDGPLAHRRTPDAGPSGAWAEHRYTVHFTGDTRPTWALLDFCAKFTAAEGSIGMAYVSHDIGSFLGGKIPGVPADQFEGGGYGDKLPDDYYIRWMQFGTFQPIFRAHGWGKRLPFEYDGDAREAAARFIRLRESLIPYLYTLGREAHRTGLPMVRAMYLEHPEEENAYVYDRQYLLGEHLLVAPIASAGAVAEKEVWFPRGRWTDLFTGETHEGPGVRTITCDFFTMPVFVRAGGIVPMQPYMDFAGQRPVDPLIVLVGSGPTVSSHSTKMLATATRTRTASTPTL